MTNDEIRGIALKLEMCKQSKDVQYWIEIAKKLAEDVKIQNYNARGEDAVAAINTIKGIDMVCMMDEIYKSQIKSDLVKPNTQIIRP